ncbi:MAG TPA: AraC family transcriptional regulator [Bacteroidaceae bacterium]|nr:AraC family transcriptional regulator [Bacteroidaceae bacterium]
MIRIKEGFKGERYIFLPFPIIKMLKNNPITKDLYLTCIGYFPHALYHHIIRTSGCDEYILIYCVKGSGWCKIANNIYDISENQYIIIPRNISHSYGSSNNDPWTIYWVHFNGSKASFFSSNSYSPQTIKPSLDSRIIERVSLFEEILRVVLNSYSEENTIYACTCLTYFLSTIKYINIFRSSKKENNEQTHKLTNLAFHFMSENIEQRIYLEDIAHYLGVTPGYFSSYFTKATGVSPINYFNRMKIQYACKLLKNTNLKIIEISNKLGFSDPYYFTRLFTKNMGISPSKYRFQSNKTE